MMKLKMLVLAATMIAVCTSAVAQSSTNADWVGIWHADADGQPTGALSLATDTGELGGTLVLDMLSREGGQAHVIESEPHVLMNPRVDGNMLTFEVKMGKPDRASMVARFNVTLTSGSKANIHCVSCGLNAPVVELTKGR
jgi:hypothetical protein